MAFPQTEDELRLLLDNMVSKGASDTQKKSVIDEFFSLKKQGSLDSQQPAFSKDLAQEKLKSQPLIGGAIAEKGLLAGGLENIKTGIEASGVPEKLATGFSEIKEGVSGVAGVVKEGIQDPFGAIPEAIEEKGVVGGLISGGKENLQTALEEYIPELGMQIPKIVGGGLEAAFSIPVSVIEKIPLGEPALELLSEKVNDFSTITVDTLVPNAMPEERDNLVQSFNNLITLGMIKVAPAVNEGVIKTAKKGFESTKKGAGIAKEKIAPTATVEEIVGRIAQGLPEDIPKVAKALSDVVVEGVKTYKDLTTRAKSRIKELSIKQDELLSTNKKTYKAGDTEVTAKVKSTGETVKSNPVLDAIEHFKKFEKDTPSKLAEVLDWEARFKGEGLTIKELNNIAREYSRHKSKSFTKAGEPKAGVGAIEYEATRSAIKDITRKAFDDPLLEAIDSQMSNLFTLERLSKNMEKNVNKITQKVETRTFMEKLGRAIAIPGSAVLNKLGVKSFITKLLLESNKGHKTLNSIAIQEALSKNLKTLERITEMDAGKAMDALIELAKENIPKANTAQWWAEFQESLGVKALPEGQSIQVPGATDPIKARGQQLREGAGIFEESKPFKEAATPKKSTGNKGNNLTGVKPSDTLSSMEPLLKEAKKHKTADEFIKTQGDPLYHGTNADFKVFDKSKIGSATDEGLFGRGFYFGNTENFARVAPRGRLAKNVMEVYPSSRNLFDIAKIKSKAEMADLLDMSEAALTKNSDGIIMPVRGQVNQFTSHVRDLGYDGVVVKRGGDAIETVIFDAENLKTRSQLIDIWDEANQ
ncbi:hypothetical protein HN682_08150 [Candidatus Peregrinibacteria bacterium]|jgi:hypothetical protein|nr:hypothetical protein [Candidatus Peregrinibacteria bacterium]